jgi:hypothetical protein
MDLKAEILKTHSKEQCAKIVKYIGNDQSKFDELMKLFFSGEYRVTQRAAWPMSYCVHDHPKLIAPYFKKIIELLEKPAVHQAVTRNITRLFQHVKVPKKYQGQLMDVCFRFVEDPKTTIAVKAFSLTVLDNMSNEYPEIKPELKLLIEQNWNESTAAFKSRAKKILEKLM